MRLIVVHGNSQLPVKYLYVDIFSEILNTVQSDNKKYTCNFWMNPSICANFITFVHEILDSPSYFELHLFLFHKKIILFIIAMLIKFK